MSPSPHGARKAVLAALAVCATAAGCGAQGHRAGSRSEGAPGPVALAGATLSAWDGETLSRRLSVERLVVAPSAIGPLRIAALHEVSLTRARYDVFLADDEELSPAAPRRRDGRGRTSLLAEPVRPGVRVVAGSVAGLEWWTSRGGVPVTRVDAARARVDVRKGDVTLQGFRMMHLPTSRSLEATRAVWREREREFVVDGEFELSDGARVLRGRGLRVDAELRVVGR